MRRKLGRLVISKLWTLSNMKIRVDTHIHMHIHYTYIQTKTHKRILLFHKFNYDSVGGMFVLILLTNEPCSVVFLQSMAQVYLTSQQSPVNK